MVTDHIVEFTENGIKTEKNDVLPADIIVTATGLKLHFLGGVKVTVDKVPMDVSSKFIYKGFMMHGVPNFFMGGGYTNASWTLKVDLTMQASANLIKSIEGSGTYRYCSPELPSHKMEAFPLIDLSSGYIQRGKDIMPRQSTSYPWRLYQNYLYDTYFLKYANLEDSSLKFYK